MQLKKNVKTLVFLTGYNASQFAKKIGVRQCVLSRALNRHRVSPLTAKKIAEGLGMATIDILEVSE